jgi:hypothetical protein
VVHTNIKSRIKHNGKRRSIFDIPNLPPSVLKPIATIPAEEYIKQRKSRIPGDGFLNPVLIKAGRLGTRDAIIKQHQSRIRSTGRRGVKTQTPIYNDKGDPDPIEVTQTQTQSQVPRDDQPGFAVRQIERAKATTARYEKSRPKLPFTSASPPLPPRLETNNNGHRIRFTARSPPRPRHGGYNQEIDMDYDDENPPTARPAQDIPGLVTPKVGFGTRYKKRVDFDNANPNDTHLPAPQPGQGFIRRRSGLLWEPSSAEVRGEPIYHIEDEMERKEPASSTLPVGMGQYRNRNEKDQEPLFLPHDEADRDVDDTQDQDIESNTSRHDPAPAKTINNDNSSNLTRNDTGLSGAQLCNTLLQSAVNLPLPLKRTSKSRREEKREEMARRINERDESKTPRPEGMGLSDKVHGYGPLFDELELEEEQEVGLQPTMSQLRRRREFGLDRTSGSIEQGMISNTQIGDNENSSQSAIATRHTIG